MWSCSVSISVPFSCDAGGSREALPVSVSISSLSDVMLANLGRGHLSQILSQPFSCDHDWRVSGAVPVCISIPSIWDGMLANLVRRHVSQFLPNPFQMWCWWLSGGGTCLTYCENDAYLSALVSCGQWPFGSICGHFTLMRDPWLLWVSGCTKMLYLQVSEKRGWTGWRVSCDICKDCLVIVAACCKHGVKLT